MRQVHASQSRALKLNFNNFIFEILQYNKDRLILLRLKMNLHHCPKIVNTFDVDVLIINSYCRPSGKSLESIFGTWLSQALDRNERERK